MSRWPPLRDVGAAFPAGCRDHHDAVAPLRGRGHDPGGQVHLVVGVRPHPENGAEPGDVRRSPHGVDVLSVGDGGDAHVVSPLRLGESYEEIVGAAAGMACARAVRGLAVGRRVCLRTHHGDAARCAAAPHGWSGRRDRSAGPLGPAGRAGGVRVPADARGDVRRRAVRLSRRGPGRRGIRDAYVGARRDPGRRRRRGGRGAGRRDELPHPAGRAGLVLQLLERRAGRRWGAPVSSASSGCSPAACRPASCSLPLRGGVRGSRIASC